MSRIVTTQNICDRCRKELPMYPKFKIMQGSKNKMISVSTRNDWGDGYPYDSIKDLCPDCTKAFEKFMDEV